MPIRTQHLKSTVKKITTTLAITIVVSANAYSNEDTPSITKNSSDFSLTGFREIKWQDSIVTHQNELTQLEGDSKILRHKHKNENENLTLGSATITELNYLFKKQQFIGVIFYSD